MKRIYIYKNNTELSEETQVKLSAILPEYGFEEVNEYSSDVDLIACIGGDGTFLNMAHKCNFPTSPIIGINTGHLGFFQEVLPSDLNEFMEIYTAGNYSLQTIKPIAADIYCEDEVYRHYGLNEIMIRGPHTHITHLSVEIDGITVQDFCGDGILVSTNVGSTAYNYSLGGSIVAPELDVLQMTPIAPSNTNAYRCFHSSVIYPSHKKVTLITENNTKTDELFIAYDGLLNTYDNVSKIVISQSEMSVNLIRFSDYGYWAKLKDKLL